MIRRGFTLLEVLIALGMILALISVMMSVTTSIREGKERLYVSMSTEYGAMVAFELLESASDTCIAVDSYGQSGIVGDATELVISSSSIAIGEMGGGDGAVSPLFDLERIRFSLRDTDFMIGNDVSGQEILVPSVTAIRFMYFDGTDWQSSWDSGQDGLPHAIELAMWTSSWPEGTYPSWMPDVENQEDEESNQDFLADEDAATGLNDLERDISFTEDDEPSADYRRTVAVFAPRLSEEESDSFVLEESISP